MKKEFAPYEQSLALKELGFDEPCFAWYDGRYPSSINQDYCKNSEEWLNTIHCATPLYQQAFRWFREKYGYLPNIHNFNGNFKATLSGNCNWLGSWTKTYEEAELACLIKLIEIVKK